MSIANMMLPLDEFLEPLVNKIKQNLRQELERQAERIISEEVAKFALGLSSIVSFEDTKQHYVITVKKEQK